MILTPGRMVPMPLTDFLTLCQPAAATGLRSMASSIRHAAPAPGLGLRPSADHWIVDALAGVGEGQRNDTAARLAGFLQRRGIPEDVALAILEPWADRCNPMFDGKELSSVVSGIYRRYGPLISLGRSGGQDTRFDVEPIGSFLSRAPEKIDWLIEPIIPRGGMVLISGDPEAGKTWLALDAAISIASGRDWLGRFATQQGSVILIDEETTDAGFGERLRLLLRAGGYGPDELPISIALRKGLNLSNPQRVVELASAIERVKPALVVIDPLREIFEGNENSAEEVAAVFRAMRQAAGDNAPAFLVIHHNRKNDESYRGSSHIQATLDARLSVSAVNDALSKVKHTKARYTERMASFGVKRDLAGGVARLTFVELERDSEADKGRTGPAVDRAAAEIEEFFAWRGGQLVPKADLLAALEPDDIKPASIDAALRRFESQGRVIRKPDPDNGRHRLIGWVEAHSDKPALVSPISTNGAVPQSEEA